MFIRVTSVLNLELYSSRFRMLFYELLQFFLSDRICFINRRAGMLMHAEVVHYPMRPVHGKLHPCIALDMLVRFSTHTTILVT